MSANVPTREQIKSLARITGDITVEPILYATSDGPIVYRRPAGPAYHASVSKFVEIRGDGMRRGLSGSGATEAEALADLYANATDENGFLTVNGMDPDTGQYGEQNYVLLNDLVYRLPRGNYADLIAEVRALRAPISTF